MAERRMTGGVSGRAALALAAALMLLGAGSAAARPPRLTRTSEDIPIPPAPPSAIPTPGLTAPGVSPSATVPSGTSSPLPTPPLPAEAPSAGACTKDQAGAKAEQLMGLLETLIQRDPERARLLVNQLQATVQRYEQHQIDLGGECHAYDALIARAAG